MNIYKSKTPIIILLTLWLGIFGVSPGYAITVNEAQKLLASDGAQGDELGVSISISGETAVIGAFADDDNASGSGSAYIFVRDSTGTWIEQQKLTASDAATDDRFGISASISGDTAVIGAQFDDDNGNSSGSAYIFVRDNTGTWNEQQKLTASDGAANDDFGISSSIYGDTAVIGAWQNASNAGAAYVFVRDGSGMWSEQEKLIAIDGKAGDRLGYSVSIFADTAVIGTFANNSAYVFVRDGIGVWSEQQKLIATDFPAGDRFGFSVSVSADTAVIGADRDNSNTGSAYVFVRDGAGVWSGQQKLIGSEASPGDEFGSSVSISGNTAVIGAIRADDDGTESGSAYVFVRDGTGMWYEEKKLTPSDATAGDWFGTSVSISGATAVVGARRDDDNGTHSGLAYAFDASEGTAVDHLLLCNTLDSNDAILNSTFGPDLAFYNNLPNRFNIKGLPSYVPGVFGSALTLGDGPAYASQVSAHNVLLENAHQLLDPDQGTVEIWFKQNADPVPNQRNPYRIFEGFFGVGGGMVLQSNGDNTQQQPRLEFGLTFGGVTTEAISLADNLPGYNISAMNGQWIHIAAVWNRAGIDGSSETMRLFVDGTTVAVSTLQGWGNSVGENIEIAGGNDADIANSFLVDELKIWSVSKTDFSDRFVGGCTLAELTIEKLINHRVRTSPGTAAQLLTGTDYRVEYKVTNNSSSRLTQVQVLENGELVCNVYGLDPGESKQRNRCARSQNVLNGSNNVPATVIAKVSDTNQVLTSRTNAYYTGFTNMPGHLIVTHYINNSNADTQVSAEPVSSNQADVLFRVENTGDIELYRVKTYHDPVAPVNSGWQQQCFFGAMMPGQVRYCKRAINVTQTGPHKAFGRVQGLNANVSATGVVNAANPTYFNVTLP